MFRFYPVEGEKEKQAVLAVVNSPDLVEQIGKFFYDTTKKFIASESYTLVGGKICGVDLVRLVLKAVPIYWVAIDLVSFNNDQSYISSRFMLMNSLRLVFSSNRKTILMVLIHRLNSLIYWTISIRKLAFQSKSSCVNSRMLQLYFLGCGSLESNGASGDSEETYP
jgi:hypothetical protein